MSSIDKLKLLAGLPIPMSDATCFVYPATLREIASLGSNQYFQYFNLLTITEDEILEAKKERIEPFDFLIMNAQISVIFKEQLINALEFFTKENVQFVPGIQSFIIGDFKESRMLTKTNFFEFQSILRIQHFIKEDIIKYTGENAVAKRIRERLEKSNKEIERLKNKSEEKSLELADLVGSLSINSPLNICSIWEISYYTFNDQFQRMRILEQYDTGLQSIMAGADPKKIKLKDWIQSIQ